MGENQQRDCNQGAVTSSSVNQGNAQPLPEQLRQPRNLQGLLRFAMESTKSEDASGDSKLGPMDEERSKFLANALSSLTVDMTDVIRSALNTLSDEKMMKSIQLGDAVPKNVLTAFNDLLELVDDLDAANDFYKMGGFQIFPLCFGSENETIRALASSVLGEACQNNPFCQSKALETGLVAVVLSLVQAEQGQALVKALYALSCACREYEPSCKVLVEQGGCEALMQLLQAPEPAARTKAAFLIRYLCHNHNQAKEKFIDGYLVKKIGAQIKAGRDFSTEHLLSIILALLEGKESTVISQCTDPATGLKDILETHLKHPDLADDTFTEEKEYCQELLTILSGCPKVEGVAEVVDR